MSPAARKEVAEVLRRLRRKLRVRRQGAFVTLFDVEDDINAELAKLEPKRRTKR